MGSRALRDALTQLERQHARLLEVSLAAIIGRDAGERTRQEVTHTQHSLTQQLRRLEAFCQRLQPTLDQLTFAQRRQWVGLLIDRVIVTAGQVEMRDVVPRAPRGKPPRFVTCV